MASRATSNLGKTPPYAAELMAPRRTSPSLALWAARRAWPVAAQNSYARLRDGTWPCPLVGHVARKASCAQTSRARHLAKGPSLARAMDLAAAAVASLPPFGAGPRPTRFGDVAN